jgi:hypothetical protein
MTRANIPARLTFARYDIEQIAYILGRLEHFLVNGNDPTTIQVAQYLSGDVSVEWLACWVTELRTNLSRRLFPRS